MATSTHTTKRGLPWKDTLSSAETTTTKSSRRAPQEQTAAVPIYKNVHVPADTRPSDPIVTDGLGNAYLVDAVTGVSLPLPRLDRTATNGLLARELNKYAPNSTKTNIEVILENLVHLAKTPTKIGLEATNTVLDRVLGKPVQETKNLNANVNAETLDDLLDAIEPKPKDNRPGPAPSQTGPTPADVCEVVPEDC